MKNFFIHIFLHAIPISTAISSISSILEYSSITMLLRTEISFPNPSLPKDCIFESRKLNAKQLESIRERGYVISIVSCILCYVTLIVPIFLCKFPAM